MNRNNERVLSDKLISDIQELMYQDLRNNPDSVYTLVDNMMNAYLTGEWGPFGGIMSDIIEDYEDQVITLINTQLMEDSYNDQPEFYD